MFQGTPKFDNVTASDPFLSGFFSSNIPMSCTWNGMAMLNPEPFYRFGVRFRAGLYEAAKYNPEELDASVAPFVSTCAASEMTQYCRDLWRLYGRKTKTFVSPSVLVPYDLLNYQRLEKQPWFETAREIGRVNFQWMKRLYEDEARIPTEKQAADGHNAEPSSRFAPIHSLHNEWATGVVKFGADFDSIDYTCCDTTHILTGECEKEHVKFVDPPADSSDQRQSPSGQLENRKRALIQQFLSIKHEWNNDDVEI